MGKRRCGEMKDKKQEEGKKLWVEQWQEGKGDEEEGEGGGEGPAVNLCVFTQMLKITHNSFSFIHTSEGF